MAGYVCTPRRPLHGGRDGGEAVVPLVPSRSGERPGGRLRGGYEGAEGWAVSLRAALDQPRPVDLLGPNGSIPTGLSPGVREHHKHPRVYPAGIGPADQPSVSRAGILDTPQARIPRGPRPRYDWRLPPGSSSDSIGASARGTADGLIVQLMHYPRGAEFLAGRMSSQDQLRRQPHPRCLIALCMHKRLGIPVTGPPPSRYSRRARRPCVRLLYGCSRRACRIDRRWACTVR